MKEDDNSLREIEVIGELDQGNLEPSVNFDCTRKNGNCSFITQILSNVHCTDRLTECILSRHVIKSATYLVCTSASENCLLKSLIPQRSIFILVFCLSPGESEKN